MFGGLIDAYAHSAYEVEKLDDLGIGQQVLKAGDWHHVWGLGRHLLGGQLFDYWQDPWGQEIEHYAEGDVFDASFRTRYFLAEQASMWCWGQDIPANYGAKVTRQALLEVCFELLKGRLTWGRLKLLWQAKNTPGRPWL
ncbi:hypothetical protein BH10CYA1_BH10CYA1_46530 [soil metagenome]